LTPSITPSITPTNTLTPTNTSTVTPTITPTNTITPSITPTNTVTPTVTSTVTPTISLTPSITPTITPSITPSATPAPFTPNQISNLQYWFDASSGFTPSSWTNYGLLGGAVTQGTFIKQPQLLSTTMGSFTGNAVQFLQEDFMTGNFTNTSFANETLFFVGKIVGASTGTQTGWIFGQALGGPYNTVYQPSNAGPTFNLLAGSFFRLPSRVNENQLIEISGTPSSVIMTKNDVVLAPSTSFTTFAPVSYVQFGADPGVGGPNDLRIFEVLFYNKQLNSAEFSQVETYLKTKYQYNTW
jgi:hypothetical protein